MKRRICKAPDCRRSIDRFNKSGFCVHHYRNRGVIDHEVFEQRAFGIVTPDLLKVWMDTIGVNEKKNPTLTAQKMRGLPDDRP